MHNERVYRIAALLVSLAALLISLERLWGLVALFQDIILLFALAWLIAFTLAPLVEWLKRPFWPKVFYLRFYGQIPPLPERHLFPHGTAVALVYLTLVVLLIMLTSSIIPVAIVQGTQLTQQLPTLPDRFPQFIDDLQRQLANFGLNVDLRVLYQSNLEPRLNEISVNLFRDLLGALSVIASTVSNLLLVIILSLYMNLGGHTLSDQIAALIPCQYRREVIVFAQSINKTFGGFIRGQLIQALLVGLSTAVVMIAAGLNAAVLGAILAAILMLIPFIGALLSLLPPVLIAFFQGSLTTALVVFVLLFLFQQVLVNVIMPKVLADTLGLHPLLIFAALLMGIKIGGIWGAFFGIPVAGVIYAMAAYFVRRLTQVSQEKKLEETPQYGAPLDAERVMKEERLEQIRGD